MIPLSDFHYRISYHRSIIENKDRNMQDIQIYFSGRTTKAWVPLPLELSSLNHFFTFFAWKWSNMDRKDKKKIRLIDIEHNKQFFFANWQKERFSLSQQIIHFPFTTSFPCFIHDKRTRVCNERKLELFCRRKNIYTKKNCAICFTIHS